MFFEASKILWFFLSPTNVLLLTLIIAGLLLFTRLYRVARIVVLAAAIVLLMVGVTPFSRFFVQTLENIHPDISQDTGRVDGVIVLGGATSFARGQLRVGEGGSRLVAALELARANPQARIVFTGGSARVLIAEERTEAEGARIFFDLAGLGPDRVIYENQSRNTLENAYFSKRLVEPKPGERWLLVTSAFHMPRSVATFRRAGFDVVPYPVDFRSDGRFSDDFRPFSIAPDGLRLTDMTVREWIGMLAYWLKDRFGSPPREPGA
ncbi:MAG: YdcF family protein [Pseudochelatococcus sp.]|uniref:YdcF family protein n=1 Tax=Pseudochelatococcus sp. TaxID=2020869 RepID=UPI003D8F7F2D